MFYIIHGLLQATAFLILYPLGALVALFRDRIGEHWRPLHISLQLFATFLVFVAVGIVKLAETKKEKEKEAKTGWRKAHTILGPMVVSIIILQLLWAFLGRRMMTDWVLWYRIHMVLSALIILGGVTNVAIAIRMNRTT